MASKTSNKNIAEERTKAIDLTLGAIEKQFGKGAIMRLDDSPTMEIKTTSTGSIGLDIALGVGGLPKGRIIEIYGPESSGKTTLTLHAIAEAQKSGGVCAFIDAEHALDPEYSKKISNNFLEENLSINPLSISNRQITMSKITDVISGFLSNIN